MLTFWIAFLRWLFRPPSIQFFGAVMNPPVVYKLAGKCRLSLGEENPGREGIQVTAAVVAQPRSPGKLEWVQVASVLRTRTPPDPAIAQNYSQECLNSNGWLLDGGDPYKGLSLRILPGALAVFDMADAPGQNCTIPRNFEYLDAIDKFRTFLMWTPDRLFGRFRIPIGCIEWFWIASAEGVTVNPDCTEAGFRTGWKFFPFAGIPTTHGWSKDESLLKRPPRTRRTLQDIDWEGC